jgi:hypothetical protein
MASESPDDRQRILLVTGMLGAGKTTTLRALEDLGWEAVDNFPLRLLERLVGDGPAGQPLAIGFDCRTRGFVPEDVIARVKKLQQSDAMLVTTLFLDCAGHELERRFNETRRRHHRAQDRPVAIGIAAERELMSPLRSWADMLIDTTSFSTNDLQQRIREQFAATAPQAMTVTCRASPSRAGCRRSPTWCSTCATSTTRTGSPSCATSAAPTPRSASTSSATRRSPRASRRSATCCSSCCRATPRRGRAT